MPVKLADGITWLLAMPTYHAGSSRLTTPAVDRAVDILFDLTVVGEALPIESIWEAARALLQANYDLSDIEVAELLAVSADEGGRELSHSILEVLFGPEGGPRTYCDWVRASLLANGLSQVDIPSRDLPNVLAILVATNRAVPVSQFVDACRAAEEFDALESLV